MCNGLIIKRKNNSDLRLTAILFLFLMFLSGISSLSGQPIDLNVTCTQHLSFGQFYPSSSGGSIVITNSGVFSSSGVIHLGGQVSPAIFIASTNTNNQDIVIQINNNVIELTNQSGPGRMTLNLTTPNPNSYKTNRNRTQQITVGGTLQVSNISSNPPGDYRGSFDVVFIRQ